MADKTPATAEKGEGNYKATRDYNERTERFGVRVVPKPYGWEEVEEQLAQAMLENAAHRP